MNLTPGVNFINIFCAHFLQIFWRRKLQSWNVQLWDVLAQGYRQKMCTKKVDEIDTCGGFLESWLSWVFLLLLLGAISAGDWQQGGRLFPSAYDDFYEPSLGAQRKLLHPMLQSFFSRSSLTSRAFLLPELVMFIYEKSSCMQYWDLMDLKLNWIVYFPT